MQCDWNLEYGVLNAILVCSLPSLTVCGNILHTVKAVNTREDSYSKSFIRRDEAKLLPLLHTGSNQPAEKKNAPNEIIRVPSLDGVINCHQ
jgi:hypothetical protein